jgi:hypothetical protein
MVHPLVTIPSVPGTHAFSYQFSVFNDRDSTKDNTIDSLRVDT